MITIYSILSCISLCKTTKQLDATKQWKLVLKLLIINTVITLYFIFQSLASIFSFNIDTDIYSLLYLAIDAVCLLIIFLMHKSSLNNLLKREKSTMSTTQPNRIESSTADQVDHIEHVIFGQQTPQKVMVNAHPLEMKAIQTNHPQINHFPLPPMNTIDLYDTNDGQCNNNSNITRVEMTKIDERDKLNLIEKEEEEQQQQIPIYSDRADSFISDISYVYRLGSIASPTYDHKTKHLKGLRHYSPNKLKRSLDSIATSNASTSGLDWNVANDYLHPIQRTDT